MDMKLLEVERETRLVTILTYQERDSLKAQCDMNVEMNNDDDTRIIIEPLKLFVIYSLEGSPLA